MVLHSTTAITAVVYLGRAPQSYKPIVKRQSYASTFSRILEKVSRQKAQRSTILAEGAQLIVN